MNYKDNLDGILSKAEKEQVLSLINYFQCRNYTIKEALSIMRETADTMKRAAMDERA